MVLNIPIYSIYNISNFAINGSHNWSMCKMKTYQNDASIEIFGQYCVILAVCLEVPDFSIASSF